jgi:hypothetical protein
MLRQQGGREQNQAMADAGSFVFFRYSTVVRGSVGWELVELAQAQ